MRFNSSLSQQGAVSSAGHVLSDLWENPKIRRIAVSAALCLVVATVSALSDFKSSVFANLGLGKGAFSEPPVDIRTQAGSHASPDRGGSNSWSLDYLVEANASFIRAAKEQVTQYIFKKPPMPEQPPPAAAPGADAIANGLDFDGASQTAGIVKQMQQVGQRGMRRGGGLPQGFQRPVASSGGQSGGGSQSPFASLAPVAKPTGSVAVAAVPQQPAARPVIQSQPAAYNAPRPAARAVVGARGQTGTNSGQSAGRNHRDRTYGAGQ